MSDVFISYSRKDIDLIRQFNDILVGRGLESWIDLNAIEYSEKWWQAICSGIEGADNFVLFVSPHSMVSAFCQRELQHAIQNRKRIIPFLLAPVRPEQLFQSWKTNPDIQPFEQTARANWDTLQAIQWIDYTRIGDPGMAVDALQKTVATDPQHVRLHSRLLLRLRDWENQGRAPGGLLHGEELEHYEVWLKQAKEKDTAPFATPEQEAYIAESRQAEDQAAAQRAQRERQIRRFRTAAAALGALTLVAAVAIFLTARTARQAQAQVAEAGRTLVAGRTQIASGNTQVAVIGSTLTPIPPTLTMVARTLTAGSYMIEALKNASSANTILRSASGDAELAALLSIRALQAVYLTGADAALVEAANRLQAVPQTFTGKDNITGAALSPDGLSFLAASLNRGITYLDLRRSASLEVVWSTEFPGIQVRELSFSPDGKRILIVVEPRGILLYSALDGSRTGSIADSLPNIQHAAFSPDGKWIALTTGVTEDTLQVWDVTTGKVVCSAPGVGGNNAVLFTPDGRSFNAFDRFYTTDGCQPGNLAGGVLAISADGTRSISGFRPEASLTNLETSTEVRTFRGHTGNVQSAAFSADGRRLITGSQDNTARVWDVESGALLQVLSGHSGAVETVALNEDGSLALTSAWDSVRIWSLAEQKAQVSIPVSSGISCGSLSREGTRLLVGDTDGGSSLWDLTSGKLVQKFPKSNSDIKSIALSPDGLLAAIPNAESGTAIIRIYDLEKRSLLREFKTASSEPFTGHVRFSSDGRMVFASFLDGTSRLWSVQDGQLLREDLPAEDNNWAIIDPDFRKYLRGDGNWIDTASGKAEPGSMTKVGQQNAFSPDGSLLAVDGRMGLVVWDLKTNKVVNQYAGATDVISSLAISDDNRLLLAGSNDHNARLYDIQSGRLLRVYSGHTAGVTYVAFLPGGERIVTASLDKTIRTWTTDYNSLMVQACSRIGRDLTAVERTNYGVTRPGPTCPQFGELAVPFEPTRTPIATLPPAPAWTPIATPTPLQ